MTDVQHTDPAEPTVLVVEDCEETRLVVSAIMANLLGARVVEAADGAMAVRLAAEVHPDLIVMDLDLPVLDGFEATRQILAQPENGKVPVIALSAHAWNTEWRERARQSGCDYVLESRGDFRWVEEIARPLLLNRPSQR
jgi:two-component system cell cycle response regulator DivK